MKAIVQNSYGSPDLLEFKEIDKPVVKDNEVLVRVHAAAIHSGDYFGVQGKPFVARFAVGFPKPKNYIPGFDVSGIVEATGKNVTMFKPGDEVFGACNGACAEYVCAKEDKFVTKPSKLTFEQAASIPTSAVAALQGLRDVGKVKSGQKVLINGASGGVGTFAVQIAKSLGAEVTGVCSARNVAMVQSIGADHVIDYTKEDFTQTGHGYDIILDNVANHSFSDYRRVLNPKGKFLPNSGNAGMGFIFKAFILSLFMRKQGGLFIAIPKNKDLVDLKELAESGKLNPIIDRTYPLYKTPEAMAYIGEGHAQGKVVITVTKKN
jgi:NADPH:quinone reductase-like Zn-dependent oxidoreductase